MLTITSRFQGYVKARQTAEDKTQRFVKELSEALTPFRISSDTLPPSLLAGQHLADIPFLIGNRVELLIDGEATFESILEGIETAKEYVLFQFFIVHDDEIGRRVKTQLVEKSRQGVKVFFLYDEIGSHDLPTAYIKELQSANIHVSAFHTRKGKGNRFQINFRNHRKIVVVDNRLAWIGGHNVGDEYLGKNPKFGHWRDTHLRIEGPAALAAQFSFTEDWHWATGTVPELDWTPTASAGGDQPVLIIPSGPADELETATLMFLNAINSASQRIWIASPYFVPDDSIIDALQLAGLRGVDVRILIPDKPDHLLVYLAAYSYFEEAGRTGVRFFRYINGFLHEKVMIIDDRVATVGTANFDNRSFRLNFEITAAVADPAFAYQVEQMFENDFKQAREMSPRELEKKFIGFKLAVRLARLTSPVQ